ncbi:hypothetical protein KTR66_04615 [Roseococcus sp. SDR]|uniref:hypothetical protein n=1 Tax=Roseococcus sp. SDR TaxID=2835532 RepID=UPI001BCD1E2C|nr:hypothetical protein [Roseococcus sp. SDR]MBS7789262.1 hypothetical protein [Roseococcus sp. SDR]MBV1844576.1 hypothetical protein [Roseococcus sp. SDR]
MDMVVAQSARASALQRQPIDIEDLLVWTYRDQRADVVIERGIGLFDQEGEADGLVRQRSSACGVLAVARNALLGWRVDGGGRSAGGLHEDAELVHRAVMQLTGRVQGLPHWRLVIQNAARAERPDAMVREVPRPVPRMHRDGRVLVEWSDKGKRYGTCPVEYAPSAALILAAQAEYTAWHSALMLLALALQVERKLTRWFPLRPAAPATPWL